MATCTNVQPDRLGPLLLGHALCVEHDRVIPFCLLLAAARTVVLTAPLVPSEPDPAQGELPIDLPAITRLPAEVDALKQVVTLCDKTRSASEARTAELKKYAVDHPYVAPAPAPEQPKLLHVHGQAVQHEPVVILGNDEALEALKNAVECAQSTGTGTVSAMAADGEGFDVVVVTDRSHWDSLSWTLALTPYTDESAVDHRPDAIAPEAREDVQAALAKLRGARETRG